jgi:hypothetical protein
MHFSRCNLYGELPHGPPEPVIEDAPGAAIRSAALTVTIDHEPDAPLS